MAMAIENLPSSWVQILKEAKARPEQQKFNIPRVVCLTEYPVTKEGRIVAGGYLGPPWQLIFLSPASLWDKSKVLLHEIGHWVIRMTRQSNDYSALDAILDGVFKAWFKAWWKSEKWTGGQRAGEMK